jgi:predicted nucleic acid-binding protein
MPARWIVPGLVIAVIVAASTYFAMLRVAAPIAGSGGANLPRSPELVAAALDAFQGSLRLEFSDFLILELARRSGHWPLGTFDKRLAKAEGAELLGS